MKKIKYVITILFVIATLVSCNEDEWLKETPLDFYSPENSYVTAEQFNAAVARLYETSNTQFMWGNNQGSLIYHYTSDIAYGAINTTLELNSFIDKITPENNRITTFWQRYYRIIFDANVIINRIDGEETEFLSEAQRNALKGEAMFFRAFAYRCLGHQYGGVPIVTEEFSEPKRDFVRDTREAVYALAISDLEFAQNNLPSVTELEEDGRLTKAAANHLLSELFITTGEYDKAIAAASSVIDDPNYSLMTERFGSRISEPGDVYWDLFRRENQNRNGGNNKEAIWVAQFEYMVDGGGTGSNLVRFVVPNYWKLKGTDNKTLFFNHTSENGGRGIGWMAPSSYLLEDVWVADPNDMRNSEYNMIRDLVANNPKSEFYGQKMIESGALAKFNNKYNRFWNAIVAKTAPLGNFPIEAMENTETGETNKFAAKTFRDHYYMRLAETYLLRAEAYLGKGDQASAANDINVVRARANATPVSAGNVDINYILDERARELNFEELRSLTLMRLGKLAERVKTYDPMHNGTYASNGVEEFHNLWPIPQSEIERNTEAELEQNPGYN